MRLPTSRVLWYHKCETSIPRVDMGTCSSSPSWFLVPGSWLRMVTVLICTYIEWSIPLKLESEKNWKDARDHKQAWHLQRTDGQDCLKKHFWASSVKSRPKPRFPTGFPSFQARPADCLESKSNAGGGPFPWCVWHELQKVDWCLHRIKNHSWPPLIQSSTNKKHTQFSVHPVNPSKHSIFNMELIQIIAQPLHFSRGSDVCLNLCSTPSCGCALSGPQADTQWRAKRPLGQKMSGWTA